jgi:hypothetical protein
MVLALSLGMAIGVGAVWYFLAAMLPTAEGWHLGDAIADIQVELTAQLACGGYPAGAGPTRLRRTLQQWSTPSSRHSAAELLLFCWTFRAEAWHAMRQGSEERVHERELDSWWSQEQQEAFQATIEKWERSGRRYMRFGRPTGVVAYPILMWTLRRMDRAYGTSDDYEAALFDQVTQIMNDAAASIATDMMGSAF